MGEGGRRKLGETYAANGDVLLARVLEDLGNDTLLLELKVHLGLVRLDLDQNLTRGDGVADLLLPGADVSGLHGGGQGGHLDDLVVGERSVVADYVGVEAVAQDIAGWGDEAPPKSGAEHLE